MIVVVSLGEWDGTDLQARFEREIMNDDFLYRNDWLVEDWMLEDIQMVEYRMYEKECIEALTEDDI